MVQRADISTRPQLPPVGFLDHDRSRKEEDAYQDRNIGAPQALPPPAPLQSPAHQYPPGPPPPYSHPAPTSQYFPNTNPSTPAGMRTPPESRRTSGGDEKEAVKQTVRQSLPSISEALGDNQPAYHSSLPPQTTPSAHPAPPPRPALASSPSPRSHRMEPPQLPPEHNAAPTSHYAQYRRDTPQHSYPPVETSKTVYADARPPPHVQTTRSPPPQASQHRNSYPPAAPQRSPSHEYPPQHPTGAMGPPSFPYGYQPYPPRYAQPAPPQGSGATPVYQPSLSNGAPSSATAGWKSESSRYSGEERTYGDSVKRQLDMYDLEGALNDVSYLQYRHCRNHMLTCIRSPNQAAS